MIKKDLNTFGSDVINQSYDFRALAEIFGNHHYKAFAIDVVEKASTTEVVLNKVLVISVMSINSIRKLWMKTQIN